MGSLDGKVAIITGAASGQGAAEAILFAREGAKVVVTDISDGTAVAEEIGESAIFLKHDVSDEQSWSATVAQTMARFGRIDILVNNAGVFRPIGLMETDLAAFDFHYRVNQLGVFLGMRAVAEPMAAGGGGSIVNISSGIGMGMGPGLFPYGTTKWAVRGMSKLAAMDLAPMKIRVNSIYPGLIETPMLHDNPADKLEIYKNVVPLQRVGTPDDVASAALFLASDASSYMTAAELAVTGGMM